MDREMHDFVGRYFHPNITQEELDAHWLEVKDNPPAKLYSVRVKE